MVISKEEFAIRWLEAIEACEHEIAMLGLADRFRVQVSPYQGPYRGTEPDRIPKMREQGEEVFILWLIEKSPASDKETMWRSSMIIRKRDGAHAKIAISNILSAVYEKPYSIMTASDVASI